MNCLLVFACISRVHRSVLRVSNFLCPEKRRPVVINILTSVGLDGFSVYILQCKGYIADLTWICAVLDGLMFLVCAFGNVGGHWLWNIMFHALWKHIFQLKTFVHLSASWILRDEDFLLWLRFDKAMFGNPIYLLSLTLFLQLSCGSSVLDGCCHPSFDMVCEGSKETNETTPVLDMQTVTDQTKTIRCICRYQRSLANRNLWLLFSLVVSFWPRRHKLEVWLLHEMIFYRAVLVKNHDKSWWTIFLELGLSFFSAF